MQDYRVQPKELCLECGLPKPTRVSTAYPDLLAQVYHKLAAIARDP